MGSETYSHIGNYDRRNNQPTDDGRTGGFIEKVHFNWGKLSIDLGGANPEQSAKDGERI